MAHKTLVGGTAYEIKGGRTLVGGTAYSIAGGKTLVNGTGYKISLGVTWKKYKCISNDVYRRETASGTERTGYIGSDTSEFHSGYSFSESSGFTLTGAVNISPANSVGYYKFSHNTQINQITGVSKNNLLGYDVTYKTVDVCTCYVYYSKGEYVGEVTADEDSLPEEGQRLGGSIEGSYVVVRANSDGQYYYYERVT